MVGFFIVGIKDMNIRNLIFFIGIIVHGFILESCAQYSTAIKDPEASKDIQEPRLKVPPDTMGKSAKMVFDSSSYHFGEVIEGGVIERVIFFTNEGPGDLIIELMTACECTTLDYSRLPIKKGARSPINIKYNSKGKNGPQIVDIDILANTIPVNNSTKFYIQVTK